MGTAAVGLSTELVLRQVQEILGPDGEYERRRIELRAEVAPILAASGKMLTITTPDQAQEATNYGRLLQAETKVVEEYFTAVKRKIDAVKSPVLDAEKEHKAPIAVEKERLGLLVDAYNQEAERQRVEAERVAREAAEKQAREDALQRAIEMESLGEVEAAEAILDEPITTTMISIPSRGLAKPAGAIKGKVSYKCKVTDYKALFLAVSSGKVPMQALQVNQSFLDNQADQFRDAFSYPGCELDRQVGKTHFRS